MLTPYAILKKYDVHPRKGLGQSFLIDRNIILKIVETAAINQTDTVVEIGAGIGFMTKLIAESAKWIAALEVDSKMIDILHGELDGISNLDIIHCDVLKFDFSSLNFPFKIIGNIPYNISSQILFRLIEFRKYISTMVLMFQKEVADRIVAVPGTKEYGILSVFTSMYAHSSKAVTVPAGCFFPKPKVDSIVLKFDILDKPAVDLRDAQLFKDVVRTAFGRRRKTLVNNLKQLDIVREKKININEILEETGINGQRRGETLTVEEFGILSNYLFNKKL